MISIAPCTLFLGDAPACQLESGHKKGGHYFCWFCKAKATLGQDLQHILYANVYDLEDKCQLLKQTVTGRKLLNEGALHYSSTLDKASLIGDLHERGVTFRQSENTDELRRKLDNELSETQRLPALLFESPQQSLHDFSLGNYEVLPVEPLHTIAGHIKKLV